MSSRSVQGNCHFFEMNPAFLLLRTGKIQRAPNPSKIAPTCRRLATRTKRNMHTPTPSSLSSEQQQTYPNSHLLVEDIPAEDLLAGGGGLGLELAEKRYLGAKAKTLQLSASLLQTKNVALKSPKIWLTKGYWRVPNPPGANPPGANPPGANPLVAERVHWRSSQSCVTGGQQTIGNPYRFLSFFFCTPGTPVRRLSATRGLAPGGVRHSPGLFAVM